jgi:hypothetical protein
MRLLTQSTATNVMVFMCSSSDHISSVTGATLTITLSKDGGAFASISPTVTERGNGWYNLALTSGNTDTLGDLVLHITATGADATDFLMRVIAVDFATADQLLDIANGVETGITLRQALRVVASALAGKLSGAGTGTEVIRSATDSKNRITATVDANGNRTAISLDVT